ncbi:MAG: DEAD/DEAH box helicase [Anaerolineales bacterium]|nr:DEAD/DEAH box helicase [Anaerolineales bacterium]
MRFTDFTLNEALQKAIRGMGYDEPTLIQVEAIPPALQGRDIVGGAQTGTGKTLAFLLPALERLLQDHRTARGPRAVVLEPTRELVIQVTGEARKLTMGTKLHVVSVYGGTSIKAQAGKLRRGADVIVATPGRLMDHMRRGNVDFRNLQVLVLDEADRMLDMGFLPDIKQILSHMPSERQTMLFSATMPPEIRALARRFQRAPVVIEIELARPPAAISQALYPVAKHLKAQLLLAMLQQMSVESMLVFTGTKQEADIVTRELEQAGIAVACIHGDFHQRERISALEGFRAGKHRVLVATNIAARGLDVEGITHVVNYSVPEHAEDYVHRIGRTARADAAGDAITLVTPDDEPLVERIEYLLGRKIERRVLPGFDYDVPTPSWARPSTETLLRRATQKQSAADRWRSMW